MLGHLLVALWEGGLQDQPLIPERFLLLEGAKARERDPPLLLCKGTTLPVPAQTHCYAPRPPSLARTWCTEDS